VTTALIFVDSPVGAFGVEGTAAGVTRVHLPNQFVAPLDAKPAPVLRRAAQQLAQYLEGRRRDFDVTLAPLAGTDFQRDVWKALEEIPFGEVRTYGDVAIAVGRPLAMRAVGNANHANPVPVFIPCHRVVASTGLGGYGGGEAVKRHLLALEGVTY